MGRRLLYYTLFIALFPFIFHFLADAAPTTTPGPLIRHLSSILKWSKSSPKSTLSDGNLIQFENGYLMETVVEGNALGVIPYSIRVSQDGELFAVDAENSNIVRITPPLSQYSRARLVAGSFLGKIGHVDGKPNDARFNHPKGVAIDDRGNVYVADTDNIAIRKIGDGGVTTIAGGKSKIPGYRDGPSEDAKFSTDFDVVYVPSSCSLLVIDRGNAALRQISLNIEDCGDKYSPISISDILMVVGAVIVGYVFCLIHQGLGRSFFSRFLQSSYVQEQPNQEKQVQKGLRP
uniref:Peptidylamidoglycolate lyase n=1 Tax=Opuntia streptacantha TaxID=393608 RepID=A0A7C9CWJ3_OPUST